LNAWSFALEFRAGWPKEGWLDNSGGSVGLQRKSWRENFH